MNRILFTFDDFSEIFIYYGFDFCIQGNIFRIFCSKYSIFLTFQCHNNVCFSQKNIKNLKIATISESHVIYQMIMQKMMDCNIIEEIKGKQNKLHVVFATFCRTEVKVIGTWKKHTN